MLLLLKIGATSALTTILMLIISKIYEATEHKDVPEWYKALVGGLALVAMICAFLVCFIGIWSHP